MSKPSIKLKIGGAGAFGSQTNSPVVSTPTPGGGPKFRLSMPSGSKPSTPNETAPKPVQKTKAGRAPKPSAKVVANKNGKRPKEDSPNNDDGPLIDVKRRRSEAQRASKKIKLSIGPKTPTVIKAKFKGKPPVRPLGEGYDSEASDREEDPMIEEEFVLRMIPGDDCEYLRKIIGEKKIGVPVKEGGADVQMKFLHPDGRRAMVTIRKRHYAATLVDLPCIVEGMKSWDKKGWYKSADICQMLHVFAPVQSEAEALKIDLPKEVDPKTFQYPHGLTPPMHFARKRRFRKRISRTAVEAIEAAVERLLEADARAESSKYEIIDPDAPSRNGSRAFDSASPVPGGYGQDKEYSEDEDAEGEADDSGYFNHVPGTEEASATMVEDEEEVDDDGLAAEMEAALEAFDRGTPSSQPIIENSDVMMPNISTPEADGDAGEESGDESSDAADDDDDDAEDEDDEVDDDERARLAELQGAKEDIAEMEKQLANLEQQISTQANPILKRRIKDNIEKVKAELQLKRSAIGEADED
jgi:transcription initiation factor TFIID subunit 7